MTKTMIWVAAITFAAYTACAYYWAWVIWSVGEKL